MEEKPKVGTSRLTDIRLTRALRPSCTGVTPMRLGGIVLQSPSNRHHSSKVGHESDSVIHMYREDPGRRTLKTRADSVSVLSL
jgi:hypothetical protein